VADERGIRNAIRKKKGWSAQSLANAVSQLQSGYQIEPRSDALLALAIVHQVPLRDFDVDPESQRRASVLARMIASDGSPSVAQGATSPRPKKVADKVVKVQSRDFDFGTMPAFMNTFAGGNHERSREAYQLLYLFENSVRETIARVLGGVHGKDWWTKGVDPDIVRQAEDRKKQDEDDPWHSPRGEHLIFYLDLYHYNKIILSGQNWPLFKPMLKRKTFVAETLHRINISRRVVAHMNGLKKADFDLLKSHFNMWNSYLKAGEADIG
jgi:hypothetical protein